MLRKEKMLSRVIAMFLIFTLTFSNFAFVSKSFATSFFDNFFTEETGTGHENVEFDAYFGAEEEKSYSAICDVNVEELGITLDLNVKDSGYLKDAKIAISAKEEEAKLNFRLKGEFEETDVLQNVEDDVIYLKQIDFGSEVVLNIPIEYQNEEYVNESKLSRESKVVFSGVYVNDEGEEIELNKEVDLSVLWKDNREVRTSSEVTKYIEFGTADKRGVILQTVVNVDTTTEKNTLPVKDSKVVIEVPTIDGKQITSLQVLATSTAGTNGKADERVVFSDGNWGYDSETNTLTISVSNEKELVAVSNAGENDNVIDGEAELVEEERFYSKSGIDSYLITYTYENIEIPEEVKVTSKVNAEVNVMSGVNEEDYINKITNENVYDFDLVGETGDIVSYNINNETESLSKAYTYVNYNSNDRYELNYNSKTTINVSYKEIVEQINVEDTNNYYVGNDGATFPADDIYYKELTINKENFDSVLGEDGTVTVKDLEGNVITVINKDVEPNENGDYVYNFENRVSKIVLETSRPVAEGNLIISNVKASTNSMYSKEEYKNFNEVVFETIGKAKYTYVENPVELGTTAIRTALTNTSTKAKLFMDRDSLSTLATNENVELRIELNNNVDTSDVYGTSTFDIELPSYVQNIEILDASIMYGEGLELAGTEIYEVEGTKYIRINLAGVQTALSSGVLNNGTNIVLNTNITLDLYTPATEGELKLTYSNAEATVYEDEGINVLPFYYSAPTGLVAVNSTTGFNNVGSVLTSVRQGTKEAEIEKDVEAKVATMDVIVMNNNANVVSDLSILGRIPFQGVKDLSTGEDLGTTVDTRLLGALVLDEKNATTFTVYYSENGEATKDLNDEANGWTSEVENFDTIKSYLIVPENSEYEMQPAEVVRFTYNYEIPAGLGLNESIYGTFLAYYKNHTDVATVDEEAKADIIGLSTGEGPELAVKLSSTAGDTIKEYEEIIYTIDVSNSGKTSAENVVVKLPVTNAMIEPEFVAEEGISANTVDGGVEFVIPTIGINEEKELTFKVKAKLIEGKEVIETTASAIADDLDKEVTSETLTTRVEKTVMKVELNNNMKDVILKENMALDFEVDVSNLSKEDMQNVLVRMKLPDEVSYVEAFKYEASGGPIPAKNYNLATYDDSTRTVTINVGTVKALNSEQTVITVKTKELPAGLTYTEIKAIAEAEIDGYGTVSSNELITELAKPDLVVSQTTSTTDTYITEGEMVEYLFSIKNEGVVSADDVCVTDYVPSGLLVKYIGYEIGGVTGTKRVSGNSDPSVTATIGAGQQLNVTVKALAKSLNGAQEVSVTNSAGVKSPTMANEIRSNEITHIIEANPNLAPVEEEEGVENNGATASNGSSSNSNITKTYKITGTAWLDENEDGRRDDSETKMSGISAKLVNSDTGVIVKSITTDSKGTYTFAGVPNGNYLVIFDYDTVKYTVTTYQKAGIENNINSDAITTKVEQDGKQRNAAVTDRVVVENSSVSNIDIGFIYADTFDLALEKSITKITIQNKVGTQSYEYDHETLAQMPITAKYLSSTTAYVEYSFKVSNVGEIAGYAKKIIDYVPNGMTFSSTLNKDWYTGTDGNLYTSVLADTELKPGESKEFTLVLTKKMTEENTAGIVNNQAEIYEDYNIYGVSDVNSTPGNKAQGENDLGAADAILTVKTGEVFIYVSVIITSIILGSIVIFIAYNQIILKRRKAGV